MGCTLLRTSIVFAAAAFAVPAGAQQNLECLQPAEPATTTGDCTMAASRNPAREVIVVRAETSNVPRSGVTVTFTAPDGSWRAESVTDDEGEASAHWSSSIGATPLIVTASATIDGVPVARRIVISGPTTEYTLRPVEGNGQSWYEKRQLRTPLTVRIERVPTDETCRALKVAFRAVGAGNASPDTVRGEWLAPSGGTGYCSASTRWRLQEGVGIQHLRAELPGAVPVVFNVKSRALPRLTLGLALTDTRSYYGRKSTSDTVEIRRDFGDSVVISTRVNTRDTLNQVNPDWPVTPTIGFDWPLVARARWLRVSAAASLGAPTKDWFFGLSLLQLGFGLPHEANGVTLNGVVHVSRRDQVTDVGACRTTGECGTQDRVRLIGAGVMFTINQTDLLGSLTTIFGIK